MANSEELRPSNRPAHAGSPWLLPFLGLVAIAAALCLVLVGRHAGHEAHTPARFLTEALGEERAAPLAPIRTGTAKARIDAGRLVVESAKRDRVELSARVTGSPAWERRAGGEWRATPFGSEAITLGTDHPEHFLTVDRRVGQRTWEWRLDTTLRGRLLADGGVGFVDPATHRVSELTIEPVEIFNATGEDVTPAGLRWALDADGRTLELNLNDQSLPEPYVIDPAFRSVSAAASSNNANTVSPVRPTGVVAGDQLLAFVSVNAPTATFAVVPPAGWTLIRNERSTTNVALWTFRKQATAAEPTPYTFTFQDPTGTNVNKTSRAAVAAYSGIMSSAPIDGSFGSNGGSNRTANVPAVSTTGTNRISVWSVGNSSTRTVTPPLINGVTSTERIDSVTAAPGLEFADAAEPTAFGPVTVGTGNVLSGNAFWAAQVFSLIPDTTAPTQTLNVIEGTSPGGQFYNSTTKTHYYNTIAGGTFTVGSVPVDADSGVTSVAFNAVALTGFTHTLVTDTTSPYASGTYTWTAANTTSPGGNRVTVTDRNTNALNELTITRDVTQPTAFTLNAPAGGAFIRNGSTVSVAAASPTDAGAGVADAAFRACPGSNGCAWADGDAIALGVDTTDQYSITWPAGQADGAYQVIARATDNVGNVRDTAAPVNVTLDNTNPSQVVALDSVSQNGGLDQALMSGNNVYYRGATAGSFKVRSTVSDPGGSGPASATFGALGGTTTGWTFTGSTATTPGAGVYDSNVYSWAGSTTSSPTAAVTPADAVGNSPAATTLTFVDDSAVPTAGALTVNGTAATGGGSTSTSSGSFSIARTDYTDAASGISTSTLTRDSAPFSNDACGTYSGSPTTIVGAPAQTLGAGCYEYVLTGTDAVGNATSITTVVQVHAAATQIALTGSITDLTSGANRVLTATIRDAAGNTVSSDSSTVVAFAQASGAGSVTGAGNATTASGVATKTFTGGLSGSVTMEATSAGLTTGTLGTFAVVHGAATQIALTGATADLTSGANRVLTATIQDAAGNTVTADNSTVVAFAKASGAGTVTGTGSDTAVAGVASKTIAGQLIGSVTTEATAGGLTTGTLGAFTVVHGSASQIQLSGATTDLTSGATRTLTATLRDTAGNTVTSDNTTVVAFAKQSGAGTVTGTGNDTAVAGVAMKTVTGSLVGPVTMEATSGGLTTGTLGAFTIVHGAAAQIALGGSTTDLASGSNRVLTATIQDAAGNTVTSDGSTVVAFAQASGAGTVSGSGNTTASAGVATKTVTGVLVGSVMMEATAAGLTDGLLGAFAVVHGAAAEIILTGSTANLASGANRALTATLQDAAGNTVTSDNSTVVDFAKTGGLGTVGGTGSATASGGVATKTVTGALVGTVNIEASSAGLSADTLSFVVVHGAASQIVLTGSPANLSSGANRILTATIEDAAGNTVTSDNSTIVAFTKTSGAGTVTGTGNDTAVAGVATKAVTGQLVGSVVMEATSAGLTDGSLGAFTIVHGAAAEIVLTGSTADLTSGGNRVLTATIKDAAGNTATSDNSTDVAFAKASGAGTVTGTGNATASSGAATMTITGQLSGSVTMEATSAGLTTGTLAAVTVVHGTATQIQLSGATTDLTSGASRMLTATIQDAAGNTVTSDSATVVAVAKASGAGTVGDTGNATVANGIASKTITATLAGSVTMEATSAGLTTGTLGAFTVVHGAATQIELTHSGSTASGDNHTLTATIRDTAGNTVTADGSTVVTFATTGGAGTVTGLGTATAGGGIATKVVGNAAAGQVDLDAQASGLTTGTTSYTITTGSASTATSTISASPTSIVANGSSTSAITVQLKDAAGNDLTGSGGTVVLGLTGAGSLSAVTDNGNGTYSATLTSPTATGSATVSGTLNAAALAATAGVTYAHGPATQIALIESGSNVAGVGHALTATIKDAHGNTVTSDSSTVVTFAKTGGAGTVTGLGGATASNGIATMNVTNRLAGQIDLDAQAAGITAGTASYTIAIGPVSPAASDSTVVAAPTTVYANGADSATITVTLRDAGANGVAGKTVTLAQGAGTSTISGGGATNASGVVTFTASNASVETVTYTATDTTDSIALTDDATVDFTFQDSTAPTNTITLGSPTRAWLTGTTLYYNGAAGGSFTLSSAVADGGSGPASALYPTVSQPGWSHNGETVSTPAGGSYGSSSFTFAVGSTGDFAYDVTASDAWTPPNTSQTTLNVTEDSTAPAASILCNGAACSAGWYLSAPVSVILAAPDAGAGPDQIRYTTDGSDPTILTGTVYGGAFDVAAQGVTTVKYRAFDRIGNDSGVQAQTVRIDTVVPDTAIDSSPAAATQDTTPTFAFSSPEAGSTFQVRVDGGSWSSETSPLALGPLAESTYTFEVRATDVAGNVDATPASFTFTVDTTPADTTITAAPPAASSSTGASFSFTASDAGPGFECRLDGGAFTDCSSPQSYTGLSEAAHTFEVRAEDAAGNLDATPATHAWTIDLTAPNTSFLSTPADPGADPTPTFGIGSTESPSTFECNLDNGGWASCSTPYTTPALGDGPHTLKARAIDAAGNTDATDASFTWLVDTTAPTGSLTAPANGADVGGTIVLASNSADTGGSGVATVVFQRSPASDGTWTAQAASWDTTAQADGDYDLRVVTTDNAGNSFASPAIAVTVDNTAPAVSVMAPNPVNLATPDPATVGATATDAGSGIANVRFDQCVEDSPACLSDSWVLLGVDTGAPYEASWPIPSDGPRLLRVRATDNAGRQHTEVVLITIDRIRPTGSLTAPVAGANVRGSTVALAATATDTAPGTVNTVTFQRSPAGAGSWTDVSIDAAAPYAGTLDTTSLADGLYDLRVFTTDAAGNAEAASATIQVRVDNTLPTGAVTAPAPGANVRGTIALTSNSADGGSGVATVVFQRSRTGAGSWTNQAASFDTTVVGDGQYDLRVMTTDNAGNAFTSTERTIRIDNTLPTGVVSAPAAGANVRGTIALTSSSADPLVDGSASGVATVQFQHSPAGTGSWTNQNASFDTTSVADGQYDLRVTTTDNAGNSFTSAATTTRVDNTLPTGSITAPATGAEIGVPPVALTSDSADAGGSGVATVVFERSPAGAGTWSPTAANWNTASGPDAVSDGSYDVRVQTTDNAGNVFTSPVITMLVDHTAPTTTASLAPGTPSNAPVTVSFNANDGAGSGVSVISSRVDGGSLQPGTAVVVPAPGDHSNDGAHVVEFFSTDEVGNGETLKNVTVVIDTTAPSGTGGDPGDYLRGIANLTYSTSAGDVSSVQFQYSPAGAGAWSNVGAADIAPPYEVSWTTTLVADGPYDLRAVVTDTTGNVADTLLPGLPKTVDNTAPAGSVTAPIAGAFVSGAIAVDANASDGAVPPASGVSAVRFEVKPSGVGTYSVFGTQTAPVVGSTYRQALTTTALADGPAELRAVVTDVAGNETVSAARTINVDNDAPVVTLDDPGAAVGSSANLTASSSADTTDVTFRYRAVGNLGTGTAIGSDGTAPFAVTWTTPPAAEQQWELIAVATDGGGNSTTSAPRTVLVDRTNPTGSVTAPSNDATVGGPAVALGATAADTAGSSVSLVEWQVKEFGAGGFNTVASDNAAPYAAVWDSTSAPDGATEIRAQITDAAGNARTTVVIPFTVDSTGPSVTLTDPGAVLSGTVSLGATTGGGAVRVQFAVSPADAGSWTQITEDTTAPFATPFDTAALADGLYDLRATGFDSLGNPSAPSLRENVRLDNTAPQLVSSAPADGTVSTSANQVVLTASEPVTAPGALLDGAPAPASVSSGNQLTFATGALADGLHVLSGELEDASGTRTPFRVAVTIEATPASDPPPVERSITSSGDWTLTVPGGLVTVRMPQSAWPTPPTPQDYILVLRVDAGATHAAGSGFAPGTQIVEVTARWAIAGTYVTEFREPLEIVFSNPTEVPVLPAWSASGTSSWNTMGPLGGSTLPPTSRDGFYSDSAGVHVLTRHLTFFGLLLDGQAPTEPGGLAGVVRDDGLTVRWFPGTDSSGQLGNVVLYVNGEEYREFGHKQFEVKLGAFAHGDTRSFTMAQKDAAGNVSRQTAPLRAVPPLAGKSLDEATAALGAAGFGVGTVREAAVATAPPGTVVEPAGILLALASTPIDLVVARSTAAPQTRLAFSVAGSKRMALRTNTTVAVRIKASKPANVTVTLRDAKKKRLHSWKLRVQAGANVVKLRLPRQIRRPGSYSLTWVARSGTETISRTLRLKLVGPVVAQVRPKRNAVEIVLAGETPAGEALEPGRKGMPRRISSTAGADQTFNLIASAGHDVGVVVVDADRYGTRFVADLVAVFPRIRVIGISSEPARRVLAIRAGAVLALPRNATAAQLAKSIALVASR